MTDRAAVQRPRFVAVIGDGDPRGPDAHRLLEMAEEVGQMLARGGATVVTGGLGGVMRAASRGAARRRWRDDRHPSRYRSGGGQRVRQGGDRNRPGRRPQLRRRHIRRCRRGRSAGGTARFPRSALRCGWARHVVTLSSWRLDSDQRFGGPQVHRAKDPRDAAALALRLAKEGPAPRCLVDEPLLERAGRAGDGS